MTRLTKALCTATSMIDLLLLSAPLEDLDMDELNFNLIACDKAIAMCREAKEYNKNTFKNGGKSHSSSSPMGLEFFDTRINMLHIARDEIVFAIEG